MAGSGNLATFSWDGSNVGGLTNASTSGTASEIDVSAMGAAGPRAFVQGLNTGTFTAGVLLSSSSHSSIVSDALAGTSRAYEFDFDDGKASGTALISSLSISSSLDQPVTMNVTGTRISALTVAASP